MDSRIEFVTKEHIRRVRNRLEVGMLIDVVRPSVEGDPKSYKSTRARIVGKYHHIMSVDDGTSKWSVSYSDYILLNGGNK